MNTLYLILTAQVSAWWLLVAFVAGGVLTQAAYYIHARIGLSKTCAPDRNGATK